VRGSAHLGFATEPVDSGDVFLFHKTTNRGVYERALASRPDCDDVLLWNERGEITETAYANVALEIDGEWLTPPLDSGLLAGTMRGHLLDRGELRETVLMKDDVKRASRIAVINSVSKRAWPPPEAGNVVVVE
jgi:para-aminobenzoate synthetase/4-amino-4-deoxychorismate lyase